MIAIAAADLVAWRLAPPRYLREVQEGVEDYARRDPQILVIGSSHARTIHAMGELLSQRTANRVQLVAIPVEAGKLTSYEWVLEHRLRPLIEERDSAGRLARSSLRRFILVTEWWDDCAPNPGSTITNLPSRAWRWPDFVADARHNGLTPFNLNYVDTRWQRLWRASAIIQDRGYGRIVSTATTLVLGRNPRREQEHYEEFLRYWQGLQEGGASCMGDSAQTTALRSILDYFHQRGTPITVVLEPRKPATITPRALEQTFRPFTLMIDSIARGYDAEVIDLSTKTPLLDSDFGADFDHITPEGNRKFAVWALDNDLAFLMQETEATMDSSAAGARRK